MRLLHTSDWHLGASDGDVFLYDDQRHFIDEICEIMDKESVDAIIIAGDVYDRSVAPAEAIKLYDYAMTRICVEMKKDAIVIAGNHDSADRLAGCRELLSASGLHLLGAIEQEVHRVSYDDADIYLLPWFTEEKVKGLYPERAGEVRCLTDAYRVVCDAVRASFRPGKKNIAAAHAFITNSVVSGSDRAAGIAAVGNALSVDADVFEGFDYVALGHIHGPQNVNSNIRYSGTPMPYSFGKEEKQEKSVTIIDTGSMEREIIPLHPLHKRTTLEGSFNELLIADYEEEVKKGYVRLIVNDIYVGLESISQLRERYPKFLEIKGLDYEGEDSRIRMTIDEFREMESDPKAIFLSYCRDIINEEPDEHLIRLFAECLESEVEG